MYLRDSSEFRRHKSSFDPFRWKLSTYIPSIYKFIKIQNSINISLIDISSLSIKDSMIRVRS